MVFRYSSMHEKIQFVSMPMGKIAEEKHQLYPQRVMRHTLRLGLLVTLVVLALVACEADKWHQESKQRPLPEDPAVLYPGEYRSEEFEPSLSFRVVEGWSNVPLEAPDVLQIARVEKARLAFINVQQVYKSRTLEIVEAPKDMVGWFQHHPYLQTDKLETISVGGIKGIQFEVVVENLPKDYYGVCGLDCVDLFRTSSNHQHTLFEGERQRVIVLEGVKGETVTIYYSSPATEFDEFALEAQRVLDSVKWRGS
jgi:hypothetical protein